MMLMALAVYWQSARPRASALVAGCLPWAKLQAVPLAAALEPFVAKELVG